jgi:prohibitin 2
MSRLSSLFRRMWLGFQARHLEFKHRRKIWWEKYGVYVNILLFVLAFLVVFLSSRIFHTIKSGEAGVIFKRFGGGTQTQSVRDEGLQIIAPWNTLTIYDVRVQQVEHSFSVLSSNGLTIGVVTSIRYRPKVPYLGVLHKEVGPDYLQKIIIPEVQALIRGVFGQYSPEEIYTTKRSIVQNIVQGALGEIGEKYVALDDLLIKNITLPTAVHAAIESKLVEEQHFLEMRFRIDRQKQEAERMVIEATGVHLFQEIIGETLSDRLLQYKGIEATLELAKSGNAKVVVIGGKNGLPIILDAGFAEGGPAAKPSTNSIYQALREELLKSPFSPTNSTKLKE